MLLRQQTDGWAGLSVWEQDNLEAYLLTAPQAAIKKGSYSSAYLIITPFHIQLYDHRR